MNISRNSFKFNDLQGSSSGAAVNLNSAYLGVIQTTGGNREQRLSDQLTNQLDKKVNSIRQQIGSAPPDDSNTSSVGTLLDIVA